jgi:hypothetical protein
MRCSRTAALILAAAVVATPLLDAAPAPAQSYAIHGAEQFFRIEWEAGKTRRGTPIVSGYIHNTYGATATNPLLQVEALDAAGAVTATRVYHLAGSLPNDTRTYFEVKVPPASSYRVRLVSWNWQRGGSQ